MAYNANIPQPSDPLYISQGDLLNNFQAIQTLIDVNHVDFSQGANQGKHFFIEFPVQSTPPTTVANEVGLYCQNSSLTSQPELVYERQEGSTVPSPVLTNIEFTSAGWANPGWTRLPSGILLKWYTGVTFVSSTVTVNLNSSNPTFTALLTVLLTTNDSAGLFNDVIGIESMTSSSFTAYCVTTPPGTVTLGYLAIGY